MPSLARWQSEFAAAVLGRPGPRGIAVYRVNAFGSWSQALAGAYPVVRKIVGVPFFDGLARAYARAYPSTSGDLNEYGARLADFAAAFEPVQDLPYLPDVARMEWLAHRAYYASDAASPSLERLRGLDGASRLRLAPACALLASPWPLGRIWSVHQDAYEGGIDVDLRTGPDRILVHRPRWRVQVSSLAPGDFRFLQAIRDASALEDALEAALAEDAAFDPSLALARWVDAGVIGP